MNKLTEYTIVHVEDDAAHWQPLTTLLRVAIGEHLELYSSPSIETLILKPPADSHKYPAHTHIEWNDGEGSHLVNYWLVNTASIDPIKERLTGQTNLTFILDVMRPKKDAGLHSSLEETLASIAPFVKNQSEQVRLFTAYSRTDGVEFPLDAPPMFKKGVETHDLVAFLLERVGFKRR